MFMSQAVTSLIPAGFGDRRSDRKRREHVIRQEGEASRLVATSTLDEQHAPASSWAPEPHRAGSRKSAPVTGEAASSHGGAADDWKEF